MCRSRDLEQIPSLVELVRLILPAPSSGEKNDGLRHYPLGQRTLPQSIRPLARPTACSLGCQPEAVLLYYLLLEVPGANWQGGSTDTASGWLVSVPGGGAFPCAPVGSGAHWAERLYRR